VGYFLIVLFRLFGFAVAVISTSHSHTSILAVVAVVQSKV
jgi:hypothetical protein